MLSRDIVQYSKIRTELYAYLTYLFSHNIRNHLPEITYAVYLAVGVAVLLISLAIYVKFAYSVLPKRER
ncbi:hypothetical protein [Helicobacter pylori]|uniref:hypothetical protein n=1 Tax=Helicobacter pylori TaxID=210 RepID=UPI000EADC157|nr:hypothetical protein [Helicobacter pylori]